MLLENAVAIVTGGASGLGAATAKLLVEKGLKVVIVDQDAEKASQYANAIGALAFSFDVTDANAAVTFFDDLEKEIGLPSILINCAGIATPAKIIGKQGTMPLDFFEKIIHVNLIGSFNMLRLAAAKMAKLSPDEDGQRGVIISTASIAAYEGQIGQTAYAASKAGIVGMTLPAAREFASLGIRVNAIAPGVILAPEGKDEDYLKKITATVPMRRKGDIGEIVSALNFLIINEYVNGQILYVDGGQHLQ
jgi:NAD(P)-dependent dehydrogenase (short-subunit alcohol dehydrogenase family)